MDTDHNKFLQMQDEMSRFEAEISGSDILPAPPPPPPPPPRCIIGPNTYGTIQSRLDAPMVPVSVPSVMSGIIPPPPPPPTLSMGSFDGGLPMVSIGPNPILFNNIPPPPPPPMLIPHQVQRARLGPPPMQHILPPQLTPGQMFPTAAYPRPLQPEAPPPKPQPVVLSGAPQLYNKSKLEETEKKIDLESLPQPLVTPKPAKTDMELSIEPINFYNHSKDSDANQQTTGKGNKKEKKNRKLIRTAGGQVWEDTTLNDWADDDFRLFCGDLGNDVTDELLMRTFSKYGSFQRAKVVRDKRTNKSKGFGFVSFKDPSDFIKAMKEMNGRYVGSRPIKLRKSTWRNRSLDVVRKKEKEKAALIAMFTGGKKI